MAENQNKQKLTLHSTKFNRPVTNQQENELFAVQSRNLLTQKQWAIQQSTFTLRKWDRRLALISESPVKEVYIYDLERSTIAKQISNITFPSLKKLYLGKCSLSSIQILQHLRAPYLRKLDLSQNHITNISALRKVNFQELHSINLEQNSIISYQPLKELNFYQRVVQMSLEFPSFFKYKVISQDLTWLVKINPSCLKRLLINCHKRIEQRSLFAMLKQKYKFFQVSPIEEVD